MDLARLDAQKKEVKTPVKMMNGSRPSSPERDMGTPSLTSYTVRVLTLRLSNTDMHCIHYLYIMILEKCVILNFVVYDNLYTITNIDSQL